MATIDDAHYNGLRSSLQWARSMATIDDAHYNELAAIDQTAIQDQDLSTDVIVSVYYLLAFVSAVVAMKWATCSPGSLAVVLGVSSLVTFAIALGLSTPVWDLDTREAVATYVKHILINIVGAVPLLVFAATAAQRASRLGWFLSLALAMNIMWTLVHEMLELDVCSVLRSLCAVVACVSMGLRCLALRRKGLPIMTKSPPAALPGAGSGAEARRAPVQYHAVSMCWIVAYTLWNLSFTATHYGVSYCMHDFTFWVGMAYLHRRDLQSSPGLHVWWAYARLITLAMQASVGAICGQTAWFRDALGDGGDLHSSPEMGAFTSLALLAFLADLVDAVLELREQVPREASLEAKTPPPEAKTPPSVPSPVPSPVPCEAVIVVEAHCSPTAQRSISSAQFDTYP